MPTISIKSAFCGFGQIVDHEGLNSKAAARGRVYIHRRTTAAVGQAEKKQTNIEDLNGGTDRKHKCSNTKYVSD